MKIAQVAPLYESVPPKRYGGIERIVSYLTEELVARGHEVTLFASGDSNTRATLVPMAQQALRADPRCGDPLAHHVRMLDQVSRRASEFDLLHFHLDYPHLPLMRNAQSKYLTTIHNRLDLADLPPLYKEFREAPLVSISAAQRRFLPFAHWAAIVYNGLPVDLFPFTPAPEDYLAFVGRICPDKGVDRAIAIAIASERRLRVAAKIDPPFQEYFEQRIRPLLDHPLIEFIGEIGDGEKAAFIGNARALLFPINWPEPFGLVMAEALACGTPVIGWRNGAVPEVVNHGVTGFVVENLDEAIRAVKGIDRIDRHACRADFETRFSAPHMTDDYERVYERMTQPKILPRVAS